MGQQQLLLLVLTIVIVGLAVVAGVQTFRESQKKHNADAMILTAVSIAAEAQAWLRTPQSMGGATPASGVRPVNFSQHRVELDELGYATNDDGAYQTIEGSFTVYHSRDAMLIKGISTAQNENGNDDNVICVYVWGPEATDITTEIYPEKEYCALESEEQPY